MSLTTRAMLVSLTISLPPMTKRAKGASDEIETKYRTSHRQAGVVKSLFSKQDLKPLTQTATQARKVFTESSLPYDKANRIIPSSSYYEFAEKIRNIARGFDKVKKRFLDEYHISVMRAEMSLGDLFNPDDYPTPEELDAMVHLSIDASVIPADNAFDDLVGIKDEDIRKLKANALKGQNDKVKTAVEDLFKRLFNSINKAATKLAAEDAIFRDTLISNIQGAIDAAETLNLTDDPRITELAAEAQKVLDDITPSELRKDPELRGDTADKLASLSEFF